MAKRPLKLILRILLYQDVEKGNGKGGKGVKSALRCVQMKCCRDP